ncbi:MAG: DUF1553 domain-containing protein [Verrucomicrobiales bacterium]|nr:DUF1553 domain-containing protein [Verrucomicrobiales bacterium]
MLPVFASGEMDFVNDVAPVLSRFDCNMSACHGKAEGQNGFKLSVFGNDPRADYEALTMAGRGRRVMASSPETSLLLLKSTAEIPHEGGPRLEKNSRAYQVMAEWIADGAKWEDESRATLTNLKIEPAQQILGYGARQPLKVIAKFSDGSSEDVTWLSVFHSNNVGLADVSENGVVTTGSITGQTAVMARYQGKVAVFQALIPRPEESEAKPFPERPVFNEIDKLVDENLRRLNLHPSTLAGDSDFLRRVFLDLLGRIPSADEARKFLADKNPDKRSKIVDSLLERPEFADFWALKWADLLRVDREKLGRRDAFAYYDWIRESVAENQPLDQFARSVLLAEGPLAENPAGHLYSVTKNPGETAATISQVFLGIRITCAVCHQHPYDQWTQQDYHGMRAFFQQVSTKSYGEDARAVVAYGKQTTKHPRTGEVVHPYPLGKTMPDEFEYSGADRRERLAEWMTGPENPWFARNLANRIWAHFLGRGLVEPIDDVRATNPASNPALLDLLTDHLTKNDFDAKALIRLITASRTYQLSSEPLPENEMDELNFARALFKRLPAEVLMDAVCDVTGVPEKFTGVPAGHRAIQLWDSQTQHYFLKLFGRPARTTPCECERATGASISQALHLMNSPNIQTKLAHQNGRLAALVQSQPNDSKLFEELYLTVYSRFPTAEETGYAAEYFSKKSDQRQKATEDLVWAMLNTMEFIFNH